MATLAELLTPATLDTIRAAIFADLASQSFPVTSWASGGAERTQVEAVAEALRDFSAALAPEVASWGFLSTAEGGALSLLCASNFDTTRVPASFAVWSLTLSDTGSGGPYTVLAGQLRAKDAAGLTYANTTGGTLSLGGTLALSFKADGAGTAFNAGGSFVLMTPLPGVVVSASSLTSSAVDEESDEELRERARARWSKLGQGTADAYKRDALDADADIRRVLVIEDTPDPGSVKVFIARSDTTATSGDVATVQAFLEAPERRLLCVSVDVEAATEVAVAVTATVRIETAKQAAAAAVVNARLQEFLRGLGIAGAAESVYRAALVEILMGLDGASNAVLTVPAADVALAAGEVAVLGAVSITWETV